MASTKLSRYNCSSKKSHHGSAPVSNAEKRVSRSEVPVQTPDIIFEDHGSLFLLRPVSPIGQSWLDENVGDENTLTFGGAIVCEPRYVEPIYFGAVQAGLAVQS
jgi:hypothetical protein